MSRFVDGLKEMQKHVRPRQPDADGSEEAIVVGVKEFKTIRNQYQYMADGMSNLTKTTLQLLCLTLKPSFDTRSKSVNKLAMVHRFLDGLFKLKDIDMNHDAVDEHSYKAYTKHFESDDPDGEIAEYLAVLALGNEGEGNEQGKDNGGSSGSGGDKDVDGNGESDSDDVDPDAKEGDDTTINIKRPSGDTFALNVSMDFTTGMVKALIREHMKVAVKR